MRSKGHSQKTRNKFIRFLKFLLNALGKARDFYVKSLERCSSRIHYGHCQDHFRGHYYELPMRFSKSSSATSNAEEKDLSELIRAASVRRAEEKYLSELIRAASVRRTDHENEIDMFSPRQLRMKMKSRGLPKNMGRIDEDKPCEFEENDVEVDFLFVGKRSRFGNWYRIPG